MIGPQEAIRAALIGGRETSTAKGLAGLPDQREAVVTTRLQCFTGGLLGRLSIGIYSRRGEPR